VPVKIHASRLRTFRCEEKEKNKRGKQQNVFFEALANDAVIVTQAIMDVDSATTPHRFCENALGGHSIYMSKMDSVGNAGIQAKPLSTHVYRILTYSEYWCDLRSHI
jgi:hypothetical protein